ncbi:hypothetical protein PMKS-002122 [Pichia membranifaciens]|uniref:Chitin biosynthesis protein n=1 Tax=Pichia membranifaciens TaxID=4926 RepID=A0A1Q2YGK4_9ASCO|nr:hypothetical protein PMKS-002122 [Pichia membranifaciens]
MVEVSLTVGKLDASLALLLTKDHHLIEFPTILLPDGISTGSIVKITCDRDLEKEQEEKKAFNALQEEIFEIFGKHEPQNPVLKIVNITQTSCVLEWEPLNLGTAELKELTLYKNGSKLGPIKNPFQKKNIKFSGLPIDTPYKFQLKLETSSGIYYSNLVELRTHKMTDLSGITLCIGDIDFSEEKFSLNDIEDAIKAINAKPFSNQVKVDTTQFICTKDTGIEYQKAKNMNIPIIRPEWIKACQLERRIVGVNKFYLDTENPIWKTKDFWAISNDEIPITGEATQPAVAANSATVEEDLTVPNITIDPESEAEVTITDPTSESANTNDIAEVDNEANNEEKKINESEPEPEPKIGEEAVPEENPTEEVEVAAAVAAPVETPEEPIEKVVEVEKAAATPEPVVTGDETPEVAEEVAEEEPEQKVPVDENKEGEGEVKQDVSEAAEPSIAIEEPTEEVESTLINSFPATAEESVAETTAEPSAAENGSELVPESVTPDTPAITTPEEPEIQVAETEDVEAEKQEDKENGVEKTQAEKKSTPSSKGSSKKKGKKKGRK